MKKILILGSRQNKNDLKKTGGVTILFELLLEEFKKYNINYSIIDTLVENNGGKITTLFNVYRKLLLEFKKVDHISVHGTNNSLFFIAPFVIVLSKFFGKTTSIRAFAGNMKDDFEKNFIFRQVIRFVIKNADIVFFETKYLVNFFNTYNPRVYWFPNVRKALPVVNKERTYKKRFVYIGTINEEKGIDLLCEVRKKLPKDVILDVYGPILEEKYSSEYFEFHQVSYKGALKPKDVLKVMEKYDVLVLPSYREGYPGVIIEAFMLGIPVIATKLEGISEMVENGTNGLLIEIGSSKDLLRAIISIDEILYDKLYQNAYKSFSIYDSKKSTQFFLEKIGFKYEA
jgi:glycosyltransferase involved in cell wall biosynthesis